MPATLEGKCKLYGRRNRFVDNPNKGRAGKRKAQINHTIQVMCHPVIKNEQVNGPG